MDRVNRFHTSETWLWVRTEHVAAMLVLSALAALHARDVEWGRFAAAFALIDLVGYVPGAIVFKRARGGPISPVYHHLYNFMHSYLTAAVAIAVWATVIGHCEWAMLALPIHLSGDRGIFGNTYKPVSLPFEPVDPRAQIIQAATPRRREALR